VLCTPSNAPTAAPCVWRVGEWEGGVTAAVPVIVCVMAWRAVSTYDKNEWEKKREYVDSRENGCVHDTRHNNTLS
jgi:hypothetical protein